MSALKLSSLFLALVTPIQITPERVIEISGVFPDKMASDALNAIKTAGFDGVRIAARGIIGSGYGLTGVLEKVRRCLAGRRIDIDGCLAGRNAACAASVTVCTGGGSKSPV